MKKFLSVLLTALIFVSMLAVSASAYYEFELPETDGHMHGFAYQIDDKVFYSDYETIKELYETGETTIYLPEECNGKSVNFYMDIYAGGNYSRNNATSIPGSVRCWSSDDGKDFDYRVNFVCSEAAEYDSKNQIGTSSIINFLGYINFTTNKAVFFNQEEMDILTGTGKLSIEDDSISVFDVIKFCYHTDDNFYGGWENTHNRLVNKLEYGRISADGADEYRVVVNENASVFDDNCLFGMLKGIFRIIFENVFKFIIYS